MQTWALSGGPVYPTGAPNQAGFYSGVLEQQFSKYGVDFSPGTNTSQNQSTPAGNIGVYSLTIPSNTVGGLANGTMFLFINGTLFSSNNFQGVADPDKGTFDAFFDMTAVPVLTNLSGVAFAPNAEGMMRTKIHELNTTPLPGQINTASGHAARMTGFAIIDVWIREAQNLTPADLVQAEYSVSGYRSFTTSP